MYRSEVGMDDASVLNRPLDEFYVVQLVSGRRLPLNVPAGANAAMLAEKIADHLSEQFPDDDSHLGVDESQVCLSVDSETIPYDDPVPEIAHGEVDAVICSETWDDIAKTLPAPIRKFVYDLSRRQLLHRDGRKWGNAGEFGQLVRLLKQLVHQEQRRGGVNNADDELSEILVVLEEAAAKPTACPSSVLAALKEEFG